MPTYPFICDMCGAERELFSTMRESDRLDPECCKTAMRRVFCAPNITIDIKPYKSMIDGSMITSRAQHKAHLREHNCFEIGNEVEAAMKPRQQVEISTPGKAEISRAIQEVEERTGERL